MEGLQIGNPRMYLTSKNVSLSSISVNLAASEPCSLLTC